MASAAWSALGRGLKELSLSRPVRDVVPDKVVESADAHYVTSALMNFSLRRVALMVVAGGLVWRKLRAAPLLSTPEEDERQLRDRIPSRRKVVLEEPPEDSVYADDPTKPPEQSQEEREVADFFSSTKFVEILQDHQLQTMYKMMEPIPLEHGQILFSRGDPSDSGFHILVHGRVGVYIYDEDGNEYLASELVPPQSVGDFEILDRQPWPYTVRSIGRSRFLRLSTAQFDTFVAQNPQTLLVYVKQTAARMWRIAHFTLVHFIQLPLPVQPDLLPKGDATTALMEVIAADRRLGTRQFLRAHELLYSQGDSADEFFLILSGEFEITTPQDDVSHVKACLRAGAGLQLASQRVAPSVVTVGAGSVLGALGFIVSGVRSGTAKALTDAEVVALRISHLEEILSIHLAHTGVTTPWASTLPSKAEEKATTPKFKPLSPTRLHEPALSEAQAARAAETLVGILFAAVKLLSPVVRLFNELGLQDVSRAAGDKVFKVGEVADGTFLLISGRVRVLPRAPGTGATPRNPVVMSSYEVGRGQTLGELSMLMGKKHDTTAIAVRDSEFVRIPPPSLSLIGARHPQVLLGMMKNMARRFDSGESHDKDMANLVVIGITPANPETEVGLFALSLKRGLQEFGPVLHVDADKMGDVLGLDSRHGVLQQYLRYGLYRSKVIAWLNRQEENYRFVLLEGLADSTDPWTRIVVSQSDAILLVAHCDTAPDVDLEEQNLLWDRREILQLEPSHRTRSEGEATQQAVAAQGGGAPIELVLLHSKVKGRFPLPRHTRRWLDARPPLQRHHHIRMGIDSDSDRLARHLANRSTGLVLGGGGSRGLAHLGVLRSLREAGIPIDYIGGTSQGAFMAAAYAETLSVKAMLPKVTVLASAIGSLTSLLRELTFPMLSLFGGTGFVRAISEALGANVDIADLWIPYFCITSNVTTGDMSVHTRGLLRRYVVASMTVVGLLPPVYDNGSLLVDGGYCDNLPAGVMRDMGARVVVAVDVEAKDTSLSDVVAYGDTGLSGWWLLWNRIKGKLPWLQADKAPKYGSIVDALTYINHSRQLKQTRPQLDLYIRPPVDKYQLLDYHLIDEITEAAFLHASRVIDDWKTEHQYRRPKKMRRNNSSMNMLALAIEPDGDGSDFPVFTEREASTANPDVEDEFSVGLAAEELSKEKLKRGGISRALGQAARGPFAIATSLRRGAPR